MAKEKVTVYTPNSKFSGVRAGVTFLDGQASCSEAQAKHLVGTFGYSIKPPKPAPVVEKPKQDGE